MKIALDIVAGFLTIATAFSGFGKLKKLPDVVKAMDSVGVKPSQFPALAALEFAGALGLIVGIWSKPIGVAAAVGITLYFVGALSAHLRKKHKPADFAPALILLLVSIIVLVLELHR
jgi:uncharacterized membrane protein YphA (DoxX/SURF4 family)